MKKSTKIMIISFVSLVFVLVLVLGITKSFMKPIEEGGNVTGVSLSSCAKIKLTSTSNVSLSNSYPMSRNKGLQTTPYKFTVTSYCDSYVGFNLYIATLSTNTIDASNIRYILTNSGSKDVVVEGLLADASDGVADFSDTEKTELNTGLKGTYGNIYKIHNESIPLSGNKSYDLYLFVDGDASSADTMGKTFKAGVAVKSYDREDDSLSGYIKSLYTGTQGENGLYYHDSSLENGANDNSYRYAGASESVNNYVCFGSDEANCPVDNLYRIIGVFDGRVKIIKADYATSSLLGTDGDYSGAYSQSTSTYKGSLSTSDIGGYHWNYNSNSSSSNTWSTSLLNKTNLNTNYLNNIGNKWAEMIDVTTWKVGGNTSAKIRDVIPSVAYQNEIVNPASSTTYKAKIGLMYVSDYGFAADSSAWSTPLYNDINNDYSLSSISTKNWMYMGLVEWTISPYSSNLYYVFNVAYYGNLSYNDAIFSFSVRPVSYLDAFVKYSQGSGTKDSPYRVSL